MPLRVAVLGSCVTRDAFNSKLVPDYKERFEVVLSQDQSAVISAVAPPVELDPSLLESETNYTRRRVAADFEKLFAARLETAKPDLILIDLFSDVHFGAAPYRGSFVTFNRWKLKGTELGRVLSECPRLHMREDRAAYIKAFEEASRKLRTLCRAAAPDARVILHSARGGTRYRDKAGALQSFPHDPARFNDEWETLDRALLAQFPECRRVSPQAEPIGDETHPWGLYFVHYEPSYYREFLDQLESETVE